MVVVTPSRGLLTNLEVALKTAAPTPTAAQGTALSHAPWWGGPMRMATFPVTCGEFRGGEVADPGRIDERRNGVACKIDERRSRERQKLLPWAFSLTGNRGTFDGETLTFDAFLDQTSDECHIATAM